MEYLAVLIPSIGIGVIFYFVMRWIFRADGAERRARANAEEDASNWYEKIKSRHDDREHFGKSNQ
ncbi:hypothetical protein NBM05_12105 [Rothia sp. AR01]|uniref:Uncharacterized protein n=1 Tax=Rothia santali TaxID=2949643 RepID=A0A9X2HHM2_9MICC|nr:hypothetical protein [Rothia santali]MCP3426722.1 hypothetical protein [Rothia santali]